MNKTEMTKNVEELQVLEGRITEVQTHLNDLSAVRKGLEIELTLGADSALDKRLNKVVTAEEEANKELQELETRKAELNQAITEELELQRQAEIEEAERQHKAELEEAERQRKAKIEEAKQFYEQKVFETHRVIAVRQEMNRLLSSYENVSGSPEATSLKALVGLQYGENFNPTDPTHQEILEAMNQASTAGLERAQKEVDEVVKKLREFINFK
ncbi:hypothetical protein [Priestia megaterium]|uniref:hypothetical protein n=1 Tax=Priestia megaterium TaxID=1404 RepID=UPI003012EA04